MDGHRSTVSRFADNLQPISDIGKSSREAP
jgi:hypothetical protein